MFLRRLLLVPFFSLAALACSGAPAGEAGAEPAVVDSAGAAATSTARLEFRADWRVDQSGPIVAGGRIAFAYAAERVKSCTGDYQGQPAWVTTAYASFDGEAPVNVRVAGFDPTGGGTPPRLDVPRGATSVEIWFQTTSRWGCSEYDSDFGRNYRFTVEGR